MFDQYIGGTGNTVPFDAAPSAVVEARALIQSRMKAVDLSVGEGFNEVLSAGYMEQQKMSVCRIWYFACQRTEGPTQFHSDSEVGLGPRVASLSLGAPAYMHFRLLRKYRDDKGTKATNNVLSLYLKHVSSPLARVTTTEGLSTANLTGRCLNHGWCWDPRLLRVRFLSPYPIPPVAERTYVSQAHRPPVQLPHRCDRSLHRPS